MSVPIARLHADRTVEMLPDVDATEPDLILVDVAVEDARSLATHLTPAPTHRGGPIGRAWSGLRARFATPERRLVRFAAILVGLASSRPSCSA